MILRDDLMNAELIPIVKIGSEKTYHPQYVIPCNTYVVKIQDLLTSTGKKFNAHFEEITNNGGFQAFFNDNCRIILSSIMPDKRIAGCSPIKLLSLIQATKPNLIITPDGETYCDEVRRSKYVMEKSLNSIDFLLDNNTKSDQLIGLILGSNFRQVEEYISELKDRKISKFCFHAGDFNFRRGLLSKRLALDYARFIRQHVPYLMIYGGGSRRFFQNYYFADAFVTQSHYVAGFKHKKISRNGQKKYDGEISWEFIMNNLSEIYHYHFHREDIIKIPFSYATNDIISPMIPFLNQNTSSPSGGK